MWCIISSIWYANLGWHYLPKATCLIRLHLLHACVLCQGSHQLLLYCSPRLKNTFVRHLVLDKWFPLITSIYFGRGAYWWENPWQVDKLLCDRVFIRVGSASYSGLIYDPPTALPQAATIGWHYLCNAACLIRPHLIYVCFVVSMITIIC